MKTIVRHSKTKSAWNVINTKLGGKYKIAIVPYIQCEDTEILTRERLEAFNHAELISKYFNQPEPKITRFEFITDKGREVVEYGEFTYSIQDDGRTLKVFKENKTNK